MSNAAIDALVTQPRLVQQFGFLSKTVTRRACCGQRAQTGPDYDYIRQVLARLPASRKAEFEAAIGS